MLPPAGFATIVRHRPGYSGRFAHSVISSTTKARGPRDGVLAHRLAVGLGEEPGDLSCRQPFRRQRQHHLVDPAQAALPPADHDRRHERAVPVPRLSMTGPSSVWTVLALVPFRSFATPVPVLASRASKVLTVTG